MPPSKFEVIEQIGQGAFGKVLLVHDSHLDLQRAVKVFPKTGIDNTEEFFREAQTMSAARHENVVRVYEADDYLDGHLYIAMEYLSNGSLEESLRDMPLQMSRANRIIADTLRGLAYLHQQNIIHRDIKPSNILIGNTGEGKLSDFGFATRIGTGGTANAYGTPFFMAPESINEGICNRLTDIYAVGATLYRALNGPAFFREPPDLFEAISGGKFPRRDRYQPHVPTGLRRIANRALRVNPEARYQTAAEMRYALERVQVGVDWLATDVVNGTEWYGILRNGQAKVVMTRQARGEWVLETRKKASGGDWRRVVKGCGRFRTAAAAEAQAKKMLNSFA